jgi:hypothetical protein
VGCPKPKRPADQPAKFLNVLFAEFEFAKSAAHVLEKTMARFSQPNRTRVPSGALEQYGPKLFFQLLYMGG